MGYRTITDPFGLLRITIAKQTLSRELGSMGYRTITDPLKEIL
jgi:hypothetical protein